MKNLLFFLILSVIVNAQTNRFFYNLEVHKKTDTVNTVMNLDINKTEVKFYDSEFAKNDSLKNATGKLIQYFSPSDQLLTRKLGTNENAMYYSFGYDYFKINSTDKMIWKLSKETKKTQDFLLQKATADFGGRSWEAWFCREIPIPEGPYKFRGLPGLIFEIYDSEDAFHYTLIQTKKLSGIAETDNFLETRYGKKAVAISQEQYNKIKLTYYENVVKEMSDFIEKGGSIGSDMELNTKQDILNQKKGIQKSIRDEYFPIERDNAIKYPVK